MYGVRRKTKGKMKNEKCKVKNGQNLCSGAAVLLAKEERIEDKGKTEKFGRKMRPTRCPTPQMRCLLGGVFLSPN